MSSHIHAQARMAPRIRQEIKDLDLSDHLAVKVFRITLATAAAHKDLLFITGQYIDPNVSRSGIGRLLKREGMSRLEDVIPKAQGETIAPK